MDSSSGTLREWQERLQSHLILEWAYERTKLPVDVSKKRQAKALFLILNTVPCILHAENRMGIKIVTMLLIEGLSKFTRHSPLGEKAAAEEFLRQVEDIVNSQILGDKAHKAQWNCPVLDDKREIG
ncbi:hypothetical protein ACA910_006930 [Epithemia clementina (nom. ined.)]